MIRRAMESSLPVVDHDGDPDLDPELCARYGVQSEMVQILRPREEEPWAFGMHQCTAREWTAEEVELFGEIGRYATLALNNTLLHARAVREMAKVNAILDQIPESAAIYDAGGRLERMNAAATREPSTMFAPEAGGAPNSTATSTGVRSRRTSCHRCARCASPRPSPAPSRSTSTTPRPDSSSWPAGARPIRRSTASATTS